MTAKALSIAAFVSWCAFAPEAAASPLKDAIDLDPSNPPLGATFLPLPDHANFNEGDEFFGVALAVAGDYAFVGAPTSTSGGATQGDNPGSVYVYRRMGASWVLWQTLKPFDFTSRVGFGWSVAADPDSGTLIVGVEEGRRDDLRATVGGAYVFEIDPASGRYALSQKLVAPGLSPGDITGTLNFGGPQVGISGDWAVLTAPRLDDESAGFNGNGRAFLFRRSGGGWTFRQRLDFLGADAGAGNARFGVQVAIDGADLCIGAVGVDSNEGAIISYRLGADGIWVEDANRVPRPAGPASAFWFGRRLDLAGGRLLANFGSTVHVFERGAGGWVASQSLVADPGAVPITNNDLETFGERYQVRAAGEIAVISGFGYEADNTTRSDELVLGEVLTLGEGGYESRVVLGDITKRSALPADPFTTGFDPELATDGETVLMLIYGDPDTALVAIRPGAPQGTVSDTVRSLLFYGDAEPGTEDSAAFAYERRMYALDNGSYLGDYTITTFEPGGAPAVGSLYGQANRDNAARAERLLRLAYPSADAGLKTELEGLFLDLAYGRAAAELILARDVLSELARERLVGAGAASYFIDTEIGRVEAALAHSAAAVRVYLDLFEDDLGLPPDGGVTTGRRVFAERVPTASRALEPARDITGASVNGSEDLLLPSHKDLVLFFEALLQHTRDSAQLAELLVARGRPEDEEQTRALIGDATRLAFEQRQLAVALFPELSEQDKEDLGLAALEGGIDDALTKLAAFEQNLDGTITLLGYDPEFLMLIRDESGAFNSFDNFESRLDPEPEEPNGSRLAAAIVDRDGAIEDIDNYETRLDSLRAEWDLLVDISNGAIGKRLVEIVGVEPPEVLPAPPGHPYATPQDNVGSDIEQQYRAIDQARLRILANGTAISNLRAEIAIERQRRAAERQINSALSDAIIDFGEQRASITQEISRIEAAQAACENLAELTQVTSLNPITIWATASNAAIQAGGEIDKGNLEAAKDRLAATEAAAIRDADDDILDNNSQALIRTLLLEMNTLNVDSQQASLLLRQEVGRLVALVGEKADLERRLGEARAGLQSRYFADPIHRLLAIDGVVAAGISFEEARKWLFFMARSLEYKWNTPFVHSGGNPPDGSNWRIDDLYQLRNAEELERFYDAMVAYDNDVAINRQTAIQNDFFSLREDYFGYRERGFREGVLVDLEYDVVNPDTGLLETGVDAITAFRYALKGALANCDSDPNPEICLAFDTVRRNGLTIDADGLVQYGDIFDPANYLDRIETVQVFIPGPHEFLNATDNGLNIIDVKMSYGGTTYLRNPRRGTSAAGRSDLRSDELTAYPAMTYRLEPFTINGEPVNKFVGRERLPSDTADAVKLPRGFALSEAAANQLGADVSGNVIPTFSERSIATTSWTLELEPFRSEDSDSRLVIDEIDDIVLYFKHRWVSRSAP